MLLAMPSRPSPTARLRALRVLAILTDQEMAEFFPHELRGNLQSIAGDLAVFDPGENGRTVNLPALFERVAPDVLVGCWNTPALPDQLPRQLRYVCYLAGSVRTMVQRRHLTDGLVVTNWGTSISRTVAEGALAHILAALRRTSHWAVAMHTQGAWRDDRTETKSLFGRTVGLHGFGGVARALVPLLQPFGVAISVCAPDVTPEAARTAGVKRAPSLEALFAENDIVVELAPLTPETEHSVTEKHLRLLRPGSVFVNVGRGAVVDEAALVRVAREGRVQFGLDVFTQEPLPADHPLRGLSNVSLTPHIAGPTTDRRRDAGLLALRNLRAFAEGRALDAVVTTEVYDQSS